jgi:hypothetical protein
LSGNGPRCATLEVCRSHLIGERDDPNSVFILSIFSIFVLSVFALSVYALSAFALSIFVLSVFAQDVNGATSTSS